MEVHLGGDLKGRKTQQSWPGVGSQAEGKGRAEVPAQANRRKVLSSPAHPCPRPLTCSACCSWSLVTAVMGGCWPSRGPPCPRLA